MTWPTEPIGDELVRHARSGKPAEVERLLRRVHPHLYRLASALCGTEERAAIVVSDVMVKSVKRMRKWKTMREAGTWYLHHTILASRRNPAPVGGPVGDAAEADCLASYAAKEETTAEIELAGQGEATRVELGGDIGHDYAAFLAAVRGLPGQQQEAVILSTCEHLDERQLGIAMDCSKTAAAMHRDAGLVRLRALVAADQVEANLALMARAYAGIWPTEATTYRQASAGAAQARKLRSVGWARRFIGLIIVAAALVGVWYLIHMYVIF